MKKVFIVVLMFLLFTGCIFLSIIAFSDDPEHLFSGSELLVADEAPSVWVDNSIVSNDDNGGADAMINAVSFFISSVFEHFTSIILPVIVILVIILFGVLSMYFTSPFHYPYFRMTFDVSGKRGPKIEDYLDEFLIDGGYLKLKAHSDKIDAWKRKSKVLIEDSNRFFRKQRYKQYMRALDDEHAFVFTFVRLRTKYKQIDGVKFREKVEVNDGVFTYSFQQIDWRHNELKKIGYVCSLNKYHCKNQRKLATRELREKIMVRDNFTCQICGKYMSDEVGLQVDHIVPVSKGGKTVEWNLRVLCDKCNRLKSNKIV